MKSTEKERREEVAEMAERRKSDENRSGEKRVKEND